MKTPKILLSTAAFGLLLMTSACADKVVRPGAPHEHGLESIKQAVEQAKTPDDHQAVAVRYEREAERLIRLARHHRNLADIYEKTDNPKLTSNAEHCRNIARHLQEAVEELRSMARTHRQMGEQ